MNLDLLDSGSLELIIQLTANCTLALRSKAII